MKRKRYRLSQSGKANRTPAEDGRMSRLLFLALACLVLLSLVVLAYGNSIGNGFTWDDNEQIVMNPEVRSATPFGQLFFSDVWGFSSLRGLSDRKSIYYRPLQIATYRITARVGGLSPLAFHVLSIVFMGSAVILALIVFWMLTHRLPIAVAAAALFTVHPIHTEAVDWASALPDIGCTVFVLAAFLLFLVVTEYASQRDDRSHGPYSRFLIWTLSTACFGAALLWKETAAVFPLLVAACVFLTARESSLASRLRPAAALSMPFWLVLIAYLLLRFRVMGTANSQRVWTLTPFQFGLTISHLLMAYWRKLIAPVHLNAYYVFSPVTSLVSFAAIGGVLFVVLATAAIAYGARRHALLSFAAAWVFITLLPVMDIYAVGRNVFAERYLFLPSVGFCLFLVLLGYEGLKWIPERFRKSVEVSALVLVVLMFAFETRARNPDWKDNATLFARTLETSPNAPFVQLMVANTLADQSQLQPAELHYRQALALGSAENPPDRRQMALACEGLAWIYSDRSDPDAAVELLSRARTIAPDDAEVDGEEGLVLTRAGRWDEAAKYLQKAVADSHEDENVLNALGLLAQQHSHQLDQAADYFRRALAIHAAPDDFRASLLDNLASVYDQQNRYADAIQQLQLAIEIAPSNPEYRTDLAMAFAGSGRYDDARSEIRTVLTIDPNYQRALDFLRILDERR